MLMMMRSWYGYVVYGLTTTILYSNVPTQATGVFCMFQDIGKRGYVIANGIVNHVSKDAELCYTIYLSV